MIGEVAAHHPNAPRIRPTVREVAEAAGVSTGTVSHALNGTGRVAPATRTRVAEAAAELNYRADTRGRALRSGRTNTLALLLPPAPGSHRSGEFVGAHFYLELVGAAAQAALTNDHALVLLPSPRRPDDLERFALDGALLSDPEYDDERLAMFEALGIPVVTLERDAAHPERSWWVASDNVPNTCELLDHLAEADGRDAQAAGITALDLMPQVHAQAGVELLLERLAGAAPAVRNVRGHLRVRGSTAEPR
jgi:DNA-binding LacI/PurR family transcriptional regulator